MSEPEELLPTPVKMLEEANGQGAEQETALAVVSEPYALDEVAFQDGIEKLSEFSSVLSGALSALGKTVHNIETQVASHVNSMHDIKQVISDHEKKLANGALSPVARPASGPSRPMSSRRRPRSADVVVLPMTDREIAEDLEEKEKEDVHASLEDAMKMLKGHHLKPVSVAHIHEDLTAPVIKPKSRPTSGIAMEEGIVRDREPEVQQAPIYNAAAEVLFEKLANRVNELEDCIKIQEAVNEGLAGAVNEKGTQIKSNDAVAKGKIHDLDLKMSDIKGDLKSVVASVRALEKGQKRMIADIEGLQHAVKTLQTRPASTRSNTGLASPVKRPASALSGPGSSEKRPASSSLMDGGVEAGGEGREDERVGSLLFGEEEGDGDEGLMDTNYEELFKRIEDLETKNEDLEAKCTENSSLSTDANLGVRRLLLEVQDVSSQLDGVLSREDQKGAVKSEGAPPSVKDFTNNEMLGKALKKMKVAWVRVFDDLHFAIDQLETSGIANLFADQFYVGVCEFRQKLRLVNEAIELEMNHDKEAIAAAAASALANAATNAPARNTAVASPTKKPTVNYLTVLVKIHPMLYQLEVDAEHLMHLDHQSKENIRKGAIEEEMGMSPSAAPATNTKSTRKKSSVIAPFSTAKGGASAPLTDSSHPAHVVNPDLGTPGVVHRDADGEIIHRYNSTMCFNDIVCVDHTNNVLARMQEAIILTTPLVDELLDKFHLKHRIDMLEARIVTKATKHSVAVMDQDIKSKLNAKVEHTDFTATMTKKASVSELQQFRELTYKQLDDIRNTLANNEVHGGAPNTGFVVMDKNRLPEEGETEKEKAERMVIFNRFELLHKQFNDLTQYCEKFVPRDEVEKAMHAIVVQVKLLKTNGVELPVMKEALKKKADAEDVKK